MRVPSKHFVTNRWTRKINPSGDVGDLEVARAWMGLIEYVWTVVFLICVECMQIICIHVGCCIPLNVWWTLYKFVSFQDPRTKMDKHEAEVPQHMDTALGLYFPGVAVEWHWHFSTECSTWMSESTESQIQYFLYISHLNQGANPGEERRGHVWKAFCTGG